MRMGYGDGVGRWGMRMGYEDGIWGWDMRMEYGDGDGYGVSMGMGMR